MREGTWSRITGCGNINQKRTIDKCVRLWRPYWQWGSFWGPSLSRLQKAPVVVLQAPAVEEGIAVVGLVAVLGRAMELAHPAEWVAAVVAIAASVAVTAVLAAVVVTAVVLAVVEITEGVVVMRAVEAMGAAVVTAAGLITGALVGTLAGVLLAVVWEVPPAEQLAALLRLAAVVLGRT